MPKQEPFSVQKKSQGNYLGCENPRNYREFAAKTSYKAVFLFLASALLLSVISAPWNVSFLAWVALVPFMLACSPQTGKLKVAIAAGLVGFVYWVGNLYWLWFVTAAGQIGVSAYLAVFWVGLALGVRFARARRWPLVVVAPVLWVTAEALQGWLFTGFGWRFLSHSQYQNLTIIQIADIFGAAGISFLIAMVNGILVDFITTKNFRRTLIWADIPVLAVALALFYGHHKLGEYEKVTKPGPVVAAVQSNVPQDVKEQGDRSDEMFAELMVNSEVAAQTGAKLIVWPETMVQGLLNPEILQIMDANSQSNIFDRALRAHAKAGNTNLLIGSTGGTIKAEDGLYKLDKRYNSAFVYTSDGGKSTEVYNKIHLVPFGEVVPFKQSFPLLHKLLMSFTPYDYDYTLDYGRDYTIFKVEGFSFATLICYEDVVPYVARNFANGGGTKAVDFLVNISNDGWFVRYKNGKVLPSTELEQHMAVCVFRAVENRVPILRSVNTGISCIVDSNGRVRNGYMAGWLAQNYMERRAVRGWFADKLLLDSRVSFFTRHGQILEISCGAVTFLGLMLMISLSYKNRKKA